MRRHPQWGYTLLLDNPDIQPRADDTPYPTPFAAALSAPRKPDEEINVRVHPECLYQRGR